MTTNSNFSEEYFKKYRDTQKKLKNLIEEIAQAESQTKKLRESAEILRNEILGMRQTITLMIENGWDPVEAKLKSENDLFPITLWDQMN